MDAAKLEKAFVVSASADQPKATRDQAEKFIKDSLKQPQTVEALINLLNASPVSACSALAHLPPSWPRRKHVVSQPRPPCVSVLFIYFFVAFCGTAFALAPAPSQSTAKARRHAPGSGCAPPQEHRAIHEGIPEQSPDRPSVGVASSAQGPFPTCAPNAGRLHRCHCCLRYGRQVRPLAAAHGGACNIAMSALSSVAACIRSALRPPRPAPFHALRPAH